MRRHSLLVPVLTLVLAAAFAAEARAQAYTTDFPDATGWTNTGLWAVDGDPAAAPGGPFNSSPNSLNYNNGTDYAGNNSGTADSPTIDISAILNPQLTFACNYQTEDTGTTWDVRFVQVSNDSFATTLVSEQMPSSVVAGACPGMGVWHTHTIPLTAAWGTIQVRFFFNTVDGVGNNFAGWFIDDFTVGPGPVPPATCGGGTLAPGAPISVTTTVQTVTATIGAGGGTYYQFSSPGGAWVFTFSLCGPNGTADFDTVLCLADDTGALVTSVDDSCGVQGEISTTLSAGAYFIAIGGSAGVGGTYTLAYSRADPDLPTSTITTTGTVLSSAWTGSIAGTASDATSGVQFVDITVFWQQAGQYWDGFNWVAGPVNLSPFGTTTWALSFPPGNGQTYSVTSTATDNFGNVQSPATSSTFTYVAVGPDSTITTAGFFNAATWSGDIAGTATTTAGGATVTAVDITIQRASDNNFFDGAIWGAAPTWLAATGTTTWTYTFAPTDGESYDVQSRATDDSPLVEGSFGTSTFIYDATNPTSTITTSGAIPFNSWTGVVSGTAADATSGVDNVAVRVQRTSDSLFWNGTTWVAGSTFLTATGTTAWQLPLPVQPGVTYNVTSRATDEAGNIQSPDATGTFTIGAIAASNPDSVVTTTGNFNAASWPGNITGTASTTGGATVTAVDITIQRASDSFFFNGATWAAGSTFLAATGTAAWTYAFTPADGETYTVQSRATDSLAAVESAFGTNTFIFDSTLPTSTITTSGAMDLSAWIGVIAGTANGGPSGVASVVVSVQRTSDSLFWNGATWVAGSTFLPATGTSAWTLPFPAQPGTSYTVASRATDGAGNIQSPDSAGAFSINALPSTTVFVKSKKKKCGLLGIEALLPFALLVFKRRRRR